MNQKTINYLVGLVGLLGVLWRGAEEWMDLKYRVQTLEREQHYIHGNVDSFLPKEK